MKYLAGLTSSTDIVIMEKGVVSPRARISLKLIDTESGKAEHVEFHVIRSAAETLRDGMDMVLDSFEAALTSARDSLLAKTNDEILNPVEDED